MHFRLTEAPPTLAPREEVNYRALLLEVQGTRRNVPEIWATLSEADKRAAYEKVTRDFAPLLEGAVSVDDLREWAYTIRLLSPDTFEAYLSFLHESQGFVRDMALLYELEQDPDYVHWQAADLSHLGEIEPFEWGEAGEPPLEKLRYIEGQGWVNG